MKKRLVLKRWVKDLLWVMFGALIGIAIYQLSTIHTINNGYECDGGIIKVCYTTNKLVYEREGM